MRPQPLIAVRDAESGSLWYPSGHGAPHHEHLEHDGVLIGLPPRIREGECDAAAAQACRPEGEIVEEPHVNPNARHRAIRRRDPDGCVADLGGAAGDLG